MKGFVCKEKDFELNALWNLEPVEVLENRSYVVTGASISEQMCSRVLDVLELEFI